MWIIPKPLHTLVSALDTQGLISELNESSRLCAQSLIVRSNPFPLRTWLLKWKRDSWTSHLSGRILKPSLGKSFVDAYLSSLVATRAKDFPQQEVEKDTKMNATCGLSSSKESSLLCPTCVSLKTSKGTYPLDCKRCSTIWRKQVTGERGEYSARLKSARLTRENGSSSSQWPTTTTTTTRDYKGCGNAVDRKDGKSRMDTLEAVVLYGSWPTPTTAEAGKIPNQPNYGQVALSNHPSIRGEPDRAKGLKSRGQRAQEQPSTLGSRQGQSEEWGTPSAHERTHTPRLVDHGKQLANQVSRQWMTPNVPNGGRTPALPMSPTGVKADGTKGQIGLENQVRWATPRAEMDSGKHRGVPDTLHSQIKAWPTPQTMDAANDGLPRPLRFKGDAPSEANSNRNPNVAGSYRGDLRDWVAQNWSTPQAHDATGRSDNQKSIHGTKHGCRCLVQDMKTWSTPQSRDFRSGHPDRREDPDRSKNLNDQMEKVNGKLNPRWVETLMDIPLGWTSPSCPASVILNWPKFIIGWNRAITVLTNLECAETALSSPPSNEPSKCSSEDSWLD